MGTSLDVLNRIRGMCNGNQSRSPSSPDIFGTGPEMPPDETAVANFSIFRARTGAPEIILGENYELGFGELVFARLYDFSIGRELQTARYKV